MTTVGVLGMGIRSFIQGKPAQSQKLMRARVVAQGATVVFMMLGAFAGLQIRAPQLTIEETLLAQAQAEAALARQAEAAALAAASAKAARAALPPTPKDLLTARIEAAAAAGAKEKGPR